MKDLITKLLCRKRIFRLGNLEKGSKDIKEHPYFKDVDWEKMLKQEIPTPKLAKPEPKTTTKNLETFKTYI